MEIYQIDNLDRKILSALMQNARKAYSELAKLFDVSPGTIHVRIEKMRQAGIIEGVYARVNPRKLGYDICCFIGITLNHARDYQEVLGKLESLEEVIEAYYTIGHHFNIFIKVMCHSMDELEQLLIRKIQLIEGVQSTETMISLQNPIMRSLVP